MHLDKKAEKVLLFIISKYDGNMDEDIYIYPSEINMPYSELDAAGVHLQQQGLLKWYAYSDHQSRAALTQLSHLGLHYFEIKRKERFGSFLTPVAVTVITNLIITALKWLLPLILQWSSHILEKIAS